MNVLVCLASPRPSPACRAAFSLACRLGDDIPVTVLSASRQHDAGIFHELRRPAGLRAVQLVDPRFASAGASVLGAVLAQAVRWARAELVLTGTATDQEGRGLVPATLAHHLGTNLVSGIEDVAIDRSATDEIIAVRCARGQRVRLALKLPVVLAVPPTSGPLPAQPASAVTPPAPETLTLADLGITPDQLMPEPDRLGSFEPTTGGKPEVVTSIDALVARWLGTDHP